ncbi:MAG: hypothetical protein HY587_07660 [Candidatus Omnitrophica bacterium]|nr:hypothetical protein [Candidatus Omnitrophota bacterium]
MDYREELIRQVNQLLGVLKQMLKANGSNNPLVWKDEMVGGLTLNIYFCEYPQFSEDSDAFDNLLDNGLSEVEWSVQSDEGESLKYELTDRDLEFLKSNGLAF